MDPSSHAPRAAAVEVAEGVGEALQLVGGEPTLINQDCIFCPAACTLGGRGDRERGGKGMARCTSDEGPA